MQMMRGHLRGGVLLAATTLLMSCAAQRRAELQQQLSAAIAECSTQHSLSTPGFSVARNRCLVEADNRYLRPTVAFPDLLDLAHAYQMAYAEKVDGNQMSRSEAGLAMAKVRVQLTTIGEQRRIARMNANSNAMVAQAASTQTLLSQLNALQSRQSSTVNTSCTRLGNTVDCQTSGM